MAFNSCTETLSTRIWFIALPIIYRYNLVNAVPKCVHLSEWSFPDVMTTWQLKLLHNFIWSKVQGAVDRFDSVALVSLSVSCMLGDWSVCLHRGPLNSKVRSTIIVFLLIVGHFFLHNRSNFTNSNLNFVVLLLK